MKNKLTTLAMAAACCLAATATQANTILQASNSDPLSIGTVVPGVDYGNFGGQAGGDVVMINELIPMSLNTSKTVLGQQNNASDPTVYNRSGNSFSPLPTATTAGAIAKSGGGLTIINNQTVVELTLPSGFTYLAAKWDGKNGGAVVYDIAGLAAGTVIDLPNVAFGHGMTGWTLIDGTTTTVPDGGMTVLLLGTALSGLGLIRRKLS